ncbi:hypothetical protein ACLOJK_023130 [Asimina triloba]
MIVGASSPQIRRGCKPTLIATATRGESSSSIADEPTFISLRSLTATTQCHCTACTMSTVDVSAYAIARSATVHASPTPTPSIIGPGSCIVPPKLTIVARKLAIAAHKPLQCPPTKLRSRPPSPTPPACSAPLSPAIRPKHVVDVGITVA